MMMYGKRKREEESEYDKHISKVAGLKSSQSVVSVVSHNLPVEMCENFDGFYRMAAGPAKEAYLYSSGIILESSFPTTAKLLACDFHYNLSLLTFTSQYPFTAASALLTPIDDVLSIDPYHQPPFNSRGKRKRKRKNKVKAIPSFALQPCSNLFKVVPDTQLVSIARSHYKPSHIYQGSGTLCLSSPVLIEHPTRFSYNELYEIKDARSLEHDGAPILNSLGMIIGILFGTSLLLPSNVVLRWWNHYKSSGEFCRPFLGLEVVNLHESDFNTLAQFTASFPRISTGVIVTKVEEDSQAFRSGIRTNDVIVKLDGKLVRSKMEFSELVWEKVGKAVEVDVFRQTDGKQLKVSFVIEEASPNQFHPWSHPGWDMVW